MQAPPSLVAFWCALGSGEQLLGRAWQPLELCSCASYTQPAGGGQASGPTQRAGTSSSTGSWQPSLPARWRRLPALPVPVVPETGGSWPVPLEPAGAHTALAVHYHSPCLGQTLWPPYSPPTPSLLRFRYYPPPLHPPYPPPLLWISPATFLLWKRRAVPCSFPLCLMWCRHTLSPPPFVSGGCWILRLVVCQGACGHDCRRGIDFVFA